MAKKKAKLKPVAEASKPLAAALVMRATGFKCSGCPGELGRVGHVVLVDGCTLVVLLCGKCGRVELAVK